MMAGGPSREARLDPTRLAMAASLVGEVVRIIRDPARADTSHFLGPEWADRLQTETRGFAGAGPTRPGTGRGSARATGHGRGGQTHA